MPRRLSDDLGGLVTELETVTSRALEWVARDAKKELVAVAARATGGDGRLSHVGRRGAKLSARYDFTKGSRGLGLDVRAVGPWQFIEYPRRDGYAIPKRKGTGPNRKRKRPIIHVPGGFVTGPITGGGISRGIGPWHRAVPGVLETAGDTFADALVKVLDRW